MSVESLNRTLEQELFALLRGASLECLVCGEFVLHRAGVISCLECETEFRDAGESRLQLTLQAG
jgi:hypothetical protein